MTIYDVRPWRHSQDLIIARSKCTACLPSQGIRETWYVAIDVERVIVVAHLPMVMLGM